MTRLSRPDFNDLSLLSLLAAHELERLGRREPSNGQFLSALRDHLTHKLRADADSVNIRNIAPSTVQLYRRAVRDATNIDPPNSAALITELDQLLDKLRIASETASNNIRKSKDLGDLKPLLAFIVSLHGQLLAQKQRSALNRSANKYRV